MGVRRSFVVLRSWSWSRDASRLFIGGLGLGLVLDGCGLSLVLVSETVVKATLSVYLSYSLSTTRRRAAAPRRGSNCD